MTLGLCNELGTCNELGNTRNFTARRRISQGRFLARRRGVTNTTYKVKLGLSSNTSALIKSREECQKMS
jgi:hypothetical protein